MKLRDHNHPCEHIEPSWKQFYTKGGWTCDNDDCPGGVSVSVDLKAAGEAAAWHEDQGCCEGADRAGPIVNAAFGLGEDS